MILFRGLLLWNGFGVWLGGDLFTWSVFVCGVVCRCLVIICVEEVLGINHGTLRGRGVWGWLEFVMYSS